MAFPTAHRILVCGRVGDPWSRPVPGSVPAACEDCGHDVVAGPKAAFEHAAAGTPIVCFECYARFRDGGGHVELRRPT